MPTRFTMIRFAIGFLAVPLVTLTANAVWFRGTMPLNSWLRFHGVQSAMLVGLIPLLSAWGTVRLLHLVRPLRAFDAPHRYPIQLPALGALTATLALILMGAQVALFTSILPPKNFVRITTLGLPDWLITLTSSIVATTLVILIACRRRKPGCCLRCGYDITHSLAVGRCPECGLIFARPSKVDDACSASIPELQPNSDSDDAVIDYSARPTGLRHNIPKDPTPMSPPPTGPTSAAASPQPSRTRS